MSKFCVAMLLVAAANAETLDQWENLARLRTGQKIEVVDSKMKSHRGNFTGYTGDALSLRLDRAETAIPRTNVVRVSSLERPRRLRNTLIGVAVGAAAGGGTLVIWAARAQPNAGFRSEYYDIGKWIFLPAGAGAGAAIGAAMPGGHETIYRKLR